MEGFLELIGVGIVLIPLTFMLTVFALFMRYINRKENKMIAQIQEQSEVQHG